MSQTQQQTQYFYSISATDPADQANPVEFGFNVLASSTFGDTQAFALLSGIAASFPSSS